MRVRCIGGPRHGEIVGVNGPMGYRIWLLRPLRLSVVDCLPDTVVEPLCDEYELTKIHTPDGEIFFLRPVDWSDHRALTAAINGPSATD